MKKQKNIQKKLKIPSEKIKKRKVGLDEKSDEKLDEIIKRNSNQCCLYNEVFNNIVKSIII